MMTIFRWRMPLMVPQVVKLARTELMTEIVLTAYALTVFDFLRKCVADKRKSVVREKLVYAIKVFNWCKRDAVFVRRMEFLHTFNWARLKDHANAQQSKTRRAILKASFCTVVLRPIDMKTIQNSFVSHREAVQSESVLTHSTKIGLQTFKSQSKLNSIVLKFVDQLNSHRGHFVADLTHFKWPGWVGFESKSDTIFRPSRSMTVSKQGFGQSLQRLDLEFQFCDEAVTGKNAAMWNGHSFDKARCELVDVHAYVTSDPREDGRIKPCIRFNISPKLDCLEHMAFDGVLELMGYVPPQ
jgi:hypothetical protein